MKPTLQGAYSLAVWLRTHAPNLYMALGRAAARQPLNGLGCDCPAGGGPAAGTSRLGQDVPADIPVIDVTASPILSTTPVFDTLDPSQLEPITLSEPALTALPTWAPAVVDNSPGFLSQVGTFLTTGGGITAALNLTGAVIQSQTARTVAGAQIARVAAGGNPAAITYRVNPTTGQLVPTLSTPQGAIPVSMPLLQRLAPNVGSLQLGTFFSQYGLYLALAAGALLLFALRR